MKQQVARAVDRLSNRFGTAPPSFRYKVREGERFASSSWQPEFWDSGGKAKARAIADSVGVVCPAEIMSADHPANLDWSNLPDECVVKPSDGAYSRGVFPLIREGGQHIDLRTGRAVTHAHVVRTVVDAADKFGNQSVEVVVEELVRRTDGERGVPQDWKVYAFYGSVGVIMQKQPSTDASSAAFKWYGSDWSDLGRARWDQRNIDASMTPPRWGDEIIDAAELISAAIPSPFTRVDMYDTPEGARFGELSLLPGGTQRFRADLDRMLGIMWEQAEWSIRRGSALTD